MEKRFGKKQIKLTGAIIFAVILICAAFLAGSRLFSSKNDSISADGVSETDTFAVCDIESQKTNTVVALNSEKSGESGSLKTESSAAENGTAFADKSAYSGNGAGNAKQSTTQLSVNVNQKKVTSIKSDLPKKTTVTAVRTQSQNSCEIQIVCRNAVDYAKNHSGIKLSDAAKSGVILQSKTVYITDDETVFDVLKKACKENNIQLEFSKTPLYNSYYIEGIGGLYEFDCGSLSGWMYTVNDEKPNYSCSEYKVKKGDKIMFAYTCKNGSDV